MTSTWRWLIKNKNNTITSNNKRSTMTVAPNIVLFLLIFSLRSLSYRDTSAGHHAEPFLGVRHARPFHILKLKYFTFNLIKIFYVSLSEILSCVYTKIKHTNRNLIVQRVFTLVCTVSARIIEWPSQMCDEFVPSLKRLGVDAQLYYVDLCFFIINT